MYRFLRTRDGRIAICIIADGIAALGLIQMFAVIPGDFWIKLSGVVIGLLAVTALTVGTLKSRFALPPTPPRPRKPPSIGGEVQLFPRKLSRFARKRIAEELPGTENSPVLFEARLSKIPLFVQLEARELIKRRVRWWRRKKDNPTVFKLGRRSTLYLEALYVAATVWLLVATATATTTWKSSSDTVASILITCEVVAVLAALVALYHKWERVHFFRMVCFEGNPSEGFDARLVIVDKPPILSGGSVPSIDLKDITLVSSTTAREQDDEARFRSIVAGRLKLAWVIVDSFASKDERFNWIGPFRYAPQLVTILNHARRDARRDED